MGHESVKALKAAVEGLHGGSADFERVEHIVERHEGAMVWEGDIYVFALGGHPTANRCYAWSEPVSGSDHRRFFAVLHATPVVSASLAVKASLLQDARSEREEPT